MKKASLMNDICIHENSLAHLKFTAQWQDETGKHTAIQYVEKFHVWRDMDLLPKPLLEDILQQPVGKGEAHLFKAGDLVPAWESSQLITLPAKNFVGRLRSGEIIKPETGRFYPKGWINGVNGIYRDNMFPVRVVDAGETEIVVDFNHPLAAVDINLDVEIIEIFPPADEHGGRCTDVIHEFLNNGPGMQSPCLNTATNFFVEGAFDRVDEEQDSIFYQRLRKVHHLDAKARKTITELYASLLEPGSRVLDLMASWDSHLPASLAGIKLSGLGMNAAELQANPRFNDCLVHDLNEQPFLPYEDESFDAVICTASVEYLTKPMKVFSEIRRVLKPGGRCIMTFSNRWFPTKSIMLWSQIHEFERIGLVMAYFRQAGWPGAINTLSSKGQHRPVDDPHYTTTQISDPVYAVWSQK